MLHIEASYLENLQHALNNLPLEDISKVADRLARAYDADKTVFLAGNGGSAASASHFAVDLQKATLDTNSPSVARGRLRAISLTDAAMMSAWANDANFAVVFSEQLYAQADEGDVLIVLSASGNSPNILAALEAAKRRGMTTIGLLGFGDGGKAAMLADIPLVISSRSYGVVEDCHSIILHMITAHMKTVVTQK